MSRVSDPGSPARPARRLGIGARFAVARVALRRSAGELYREIGATPAREDAAERARNRAIKPLERLGHKVILEDVPQAA